jgi:energy-coupling factor transporter ATP-binding protein EcfA2
MVSTQTLDALRKLITESIRIQRDTATHVSYIDASHVLSDVESRQNHVVYGRRGCGKTLLLHASAAKLPAETRRVYLNCEDFKQHTFPNVLIEVLEAVFMELEKNLSGWFGKGRKQKQIIEAIRAKFEALRKAPDALEEQVSRSDQASSSTSRGARIGGALGLEGGQVEARIGERRGQQASTAETSSYVRRSDKVRQLNQDLPWVKQQLRDFFAASTRVQAVFIQVDDFYHLRLADQPFVVDYLHRLCKDLPMYFKVATLRHVCSLFIERDGQPIGVQERHDFLPIDIDFTFEHFDKTSRQVRSIFHAYGQQVGIEPAEFDGLFKGEGFTRLVVAGGGVPRDCLSMFLDAHTNAKDTGDGKIGKDTMRLLSLETFENRIRDLKRDSQADQQDMLLRGIYAIREFCFTNRTNAFVLDERELRDIAWMNELVFRLLDYRIVHAAASAFTHKTHQGTFRAFVIDVGCYGFWRKLEGKLREIDVSQSQAKERLRSAPLLTADTLDTLRKKAPGNVEASLKEEPADE